MGAASRSPPYPGRAPSPARIADISPARLNWKEVSQFEIAEHSAGWPARPVGDAPGGVVCGPLVRGRHSGGRGTGSSQQVRPARAGASLQRAGGRPDQRVEAGPLPEARAGRVLHPGLAALAAGGDNPHRWDAGPEPAAVLATEFKPKRHVWLAVRTTGSVQPRPDPNWDDDLVETVAYCGSKGDSSGPLHCSTFLYQATHPEIQVCSCHLSARWRSPENPGCDADASAEGSLPFPARPTRTSRRDRDCPARWSAFSCCKRGTCASAVSGRARAARRLRCLYGSGARVAPVRGAEGCARKALRALVPYPFNVVEAGPDDGCQTALHHPQEACRPLRRRRMFCGCPAGPATIRRPPGTSNPAAMV